MAEKVIIDNKVCRFLVFKRLRGICDQCSEPDRRDCVGIRIRVPKTEDVKICYQCLVEKAMELDKIRDKAKIARARIKRNLENARKAKERKQNDKRISPSVLADNEGQTPKTEEKNGPDRTGGGRPADSACRSNQKTGPQKK